MSPSEILLRGVEILDPVMRLHGYAFTFREADKGSGGDFAWGEYVRGERRLELHFRRSLGLVAYRGGPSVVQHEHYMRAKLGRNGGNQYPGFSDEPLDGFRHLAHDLEQYASEFLSGSDAEFAAMAVRAKQLEGRRGFGALS